MRASGVAGTVPVPLAAVSRLAGLRGLGRCLLCSCSWVFQAFPFLQHQKDCVAPGYQEQQL